MHVCIYISTYPRHPAAVCRGRCISAHRYTYYIYIYAYPVILRYICITINHYRHINCGNKRITPDLRNAWSVHVGHPIVRSQCDCSASCASCDLDLAGPLSAKPRQDSASGKLPYHWLSPNLITHKPVIKLTPSDVGEHECRDVGDVGAVRTTPATWQITVGHFSHSNFLGSLELACGEIATTPSKHGPSNILLAESQ